MVDGIATDCYVSLTTARVRILPRVCEKVASDLGLGGVFHWVFQLPPPVTTGWSRLRRNTPKESDEKRKFLYEAYLPGGVIPSRPLLPLTCSDVLVLVCPSHITYDLTTVFASLVSSALRLMEYVSSTMFLHVNRVARMH